MVIVKYVLGNVAIIVITLVVIGFIYFKWRYQYWKRKNIPYLEPFIPLGNMANPFNPKENVGYRIKRHYDRMKTRGWKHGGIYSILRPAYIVLEPEYIKNILTKDFHHFTDRGIYYNEKDDPLSAHLFALDGVPWRRIRTKLTPTFTSGKMKMMFETLLNCAPNLVQKVEKERVNGEPIRIKDVAACFTTDVIGSCAFGLELNSFKDDKSEFIEHSRMAFKFGKFQICKLLFAMTYPKLAKKLRLVLSNQKVSEFFMKLVKDTVEYRENNNIKRNDFLQILINMKNQEEDALTIEEMAAQSFVFFIAGFDTSSTTMSFALYELAKRDDLQEKVRTEIRRVLEKHNQEITYEAIHEMKYLDQVVSEALRMYPPVGVISRKCVKDYKVPGEDVVIEKGITCMIPALALHYDEDYFPNPEHFDPERFTEENKNKRHHYTYLPFGEGPRICIGLRFGIMQTKVGLVSLLKNYKFSVNSNSNFKIDPASFILGIKGDILLNMENV